MGYPSFLEDLAKIREGLEAERAKPFSPSESAFEAQEKRLNKYHRQLQEYTAQLQRFASDISVYLSSEENKELKELLEIQRNLARRQKLHKGILEKTAEYNKLCREIIEKKTDLYNLHVARREQLKEEIKNEQSRSRRLEEGLAQSKKKISALQEEARRIGQ